MNLCRLNIDFSPLSHSFEAHFNNNHGVIKGSQEVYLEDLTQYSKILVGDIVLIWVNSLFIVKFVIFFIARVTTKNDQINGQLLCGHF